MARVTIPASFQLLNRTWQVKLLTENLSKKVMSKASLDPAVDKLWGFCDFENATIWVTPSDSKDHMIHTFLHELGHAIFYTLGWQMGEAEESMVDALGGSFHQFLKSKEGTIS